MISEKRDNYHVRLQIMMQNLQRKRQQEREKLLAKIEKTQIEMQQPFNRSDPPQSNQQATPIIAVPKVRSKRLKSSQISILTKLKGAFKKTQSTIGRLSIYSNQNEIYKSKKPPNAFLRLTNYYRKMAEQKSKKMAFERQRNIRILINLSEAQWTQNGIVVAYHEIQKASDLSEVHRDKKIIIEHDTPQTRKRLKVQPKQIQKKASSYIINILQAQEQVQYQSDKIDNNKRQISTIRTEVVKVKQTEENITQIPNMVGDSVISLKENQTHYADKKQQICIDKHTQVIEEKQKIAELEPIQNTQSVENPILKKQQPQVQNQVNKISTIPVQNPFLLNKTTKVLGLQDVISGFRPTLNVNIPTSMINQNPPLFFQSQIQPDQNRNNPHPLPGFQPFANSNTQPTNNSQLFPIRRVNSFTQNSGPPSNIFPQQHPAGNFFPQQNPSPFYQHNQFNPVQQGSPGTPFFGNFQQPYQNIQFADNPQAARQCFAKQQQPVQQSLFAPEVSNPSQGTRNRQKSKNNVQRIS